MVCEKNRIPNNIKHYIDVKGPGVYNKHDGHQINTNKNDGDNRLRDDPPKSGDINVDDNDGSDNGLRDDPQTNGTLMLTTMMVVIMDSVMTPPDTTVHQC